MSNDVLDDDKEDMLGDNEIDYEVISEDGEVLNEIMVDSVTLKRNNKVLTANKLHNIWKIGK